MARVEEKVCVDLPAVGLRRSEARDPLRRLFGERIKNRRRAEKRDAEGVGPGGSSAGDDAVILPRHSRHAQASQFINCRHGPVWISRGVSDHQLERSSANSAGAIDFVNSQLESSEQMSACLHPAGPSQRNKSADLNG